MIFILFEMNLILSPIWLPICLNISLSRFVEALEELLISQVFTLLLVKTNFIFVKILVIVRGISRILRLLLLVGQVGIVLVSFL